MKHGARPLGGAANLTISQIKNLRQGIAGGFGGLNMKTFAASSLSAGVLRGLSGDRIRSYAERERGGTRCPGP